MAKSRRICNFHSDKSGQKKKKNNNDNNNGILSGFFKDFSSKSLLRSHFCVVTQRNASPRGKALRDDTKNGNGNVHTPLDEFSTSLKFVRLGGLFTRTKTLDA